MDFQTRKRLTFCANLLILLLLATVAVAGCTVSVDDQWEPVGTAGREAAPPPVEISPLKKREAPPEGVRALVTDRKPSSTGGSLCNTGLPVEATAKSYVRPICTGHMPMRCTFCLIDFAPQRGIEVSFSGPDGLITSWSISADSTGAGEVSPPPIVPPFYPEGTYQVSATQDGQVTNSVFNLSEATSPQLLVHPAYVAPGGAVAIFMAGLWPEQSIPLYLYRQESAGLQYLTELPPTRADSDGRVLWYALDIQPDDPEGLYVVETAPPIVGPNTFTVAH